MLKKDNRLTKKKEFDNVFKVGKGCFTDILGVKYSKNQLNINKFGILVSNKVSKSAVVRNKIKRRIRAIIAKNESFLSVGYDLIVITLPAIKNAQYLDIEKSICQTWKRLKLIK